MADDDRPIFVTNDGALLRQSPMISETDRAVLAAEDLVELTPDQVAALSRQANEVYREFDRDVDRAMTISRARQIKVWRCFMGCSWRRVAELAAGEWGRAAKWQPPSNQLAGLALCRRAARRLGEKPDQPPWN